MSGVVLADVPPVPFSVIPVTLISDPATFRAHFPEFADTSIYPDTAIQFWLDMGALMCGPRWGQMQQLGVELFTAHMLALQRYSAIRSQAGGAYAVPGLSGGLMTNKSVSKVAVGYDVSVTAMEGGGPWNYTVYGQQFLWWMTLLGTGGYETLGVGLAETMSGVVLTWSRGVMGNFTGPM